MGRVKRGIQPQQVGDKVSAQRVGGRPAHIFGHVGFDDSQALSRQGQTHGQQGQDDQIAQIPAGGGLVDEVAHHQRCDHLHTDSAAQDHSQQAHPWPLGTQIVGQQPKVTAQGLKEVSGQEAPGASQLNVHKSIFFLSLKSVVDAFCGT